MPGSDLEFRTVETGQSEQDSRKEQWGLESWGEEFWDKNAGNDSFNISSDREVMTGKRRKDGQNITGQKDWDRTTEAEQP